MTGPHPLRTSRTFAFILAAFLITGAPAFVRAQTIETFSSAADASSHHKKPKPTPTPTPPPTVGADGESDWKNAGGTTWSTAANWTGVSGGSAPPAPGDVAWFKTAFSSGQPNLTASTSIAGFYFQSTGSSGYDITSSSSAVKFTLTGTATTPGGTETSNSTAAAIGANNTSGTNTIDAPIILAPTTSTSTFYQVNGGTLIVNGDISGSGITLNINGTSGGIIQLAGNNAYSGGTTLQSGMVLNINSVTAVGTGTLTLNGNATIDNTSANAITLTNNNAIALSNGSLTFTGTKDLSFGTGVVTMNGANRSITVTNAAATLTVGGIAQDASTRNFTKLGAGTVVLGGNSTYTGTTTISAGTLQIGNGGTSGSLGTGSVAVNGTTTSLVFDRSDNITIGNVISGTGSLTQNGLGTLTLNNSSVDSYTGDTIVNAGTLKLDFANLSTPTNLINLGSGLTLGGGTLTVKGKASATSAQTFNGLTLSAGASALTRDTSAASSTVNATLGAITRNIGTTIDFTPSGSGDITTTSGSNNTILSSGNAAYATVGGNDWAATDSSSPRKIVAGSSIAGFYTPSTSTTLAGNADVASGVDTTFSGTPNITSLRFNQNQARTITDNGTLKTGGILITGNVNTAGSQINGTGTITSVNGGVDLVVIQNSSQAFTISSIIGNNGGSGLTKSGTGTLVLSGVNTYQGQTYLNAGTLSISQNSNLGATSTGAQLNMDGGTLQATATFALDNSGANKRAVVLGYEGGTFDVTGGNTLTVSGVISDGGSGGTLTKTNSGTLTFTGANAYTGPTTINAGTLNAGATSALGGTSGVTVNSSGTLLISGSGTLNRINDAGGITLNGGTFARSGTGTVSEGTAAHTANGGASHTGTSSIGLGALTLNANSTLDFGTPGLGTLVFASFTPNGNVLNILNWTSAASGPAGVSGTDGTDDRLVFQGDQSGNLADFSFGGISAMEIALGDGFFEITPIPEPGTWATGGLVLVTLAFSQRRRLKSKAERGQKHRIG
jgi:autotransporter-associated beta strand protein